MLRLWAKVLFKDKIVKQYTLEKNERLDFSHFYTYITDICNELDIPTPIVLKTHVSQFRSFHHVKFVPGDFVDSVWFDKLWIENISE